jgi:hypothetical protein
MLYSIHYLKMTSKFRSTFFLVNLVPLWPCQEFLIVPVMSYRNIVLSFSGHRLLFAISWPVTVFLIVYLHLAFLVFR